MNNFEEIQTAYQNAVNAEDSKRLKATQEFLDALMAAAMQAALKRKDNVSFTLGAQVDKSILMGLLQKNGFPVSCIVFPRTEGTGTITLQWGKSSDLPMPRAKADCSFCGSPAVPAGACFHCG